MRSINILLISEEQQPAQEQPAFEFPGDDLTSSIEFLNSLAAENPSILETNEFKEVMNTSNLLQKELEPAKENGGEGGKGEGGSGEGGSGDGGSGEGGSGEGKGKGNDEKPGSAKGKQAKSDNPLAGLSFFAEGEEQQSSFDDVTVDSVPDLAKELGVDTTQKGWIVQLASKISKPSSEFEEKFNELNESIEALPVELKSAIRLNVAGKDWKSAIDMGSQIDLSKNFSELTPNEKVKIHNYYFPDDSISEAEDLSSKQNQKAIKAAEARFIADKAVKDAKVESAKREAEIATQKYTASIDNSINELKKNFPAFKQKEIKNLEEIAKSGKIYSLFFDKDGNMLPEGIQRLAFAIDGKKILDIATGLAGNKGKSEAKAEILQTVPKDTKQAAQEKSLTDAEKEVANLVGSLQVTNPLTY